MWSVSDVPCGRKQCAPVHQTAYNRARTGVILGAAQSGLCLGFTLFLYSVAIHGIQLIKKADCT